MAGPFTRLGLHLDRSFRQQPPLLPRIGKASSRALANHQASRAATVHMGTVHTWLATEGSHTPARDARTELPM